MNTENAKCACQGSTLTKFVQPIILFSLAESPDHGYHLLQKIAETRLWQDAPPDATGVYRILRDMEKRGLIRSQLSAEAKASIGKRVFSLTDEGRACMAHWAQTLTQYREGIDQLVQRLEEALGDQPAASGCCCCQKE